MSLENPDIVNAFGILAKEDTSHGFPVWKPLERYTIILNFLTPF